MLVSFTATAEPALHSRLTLVRSKNPVAANRPIVVFIPGGPGISSASLRSMDILARSFDLAYVDTPGTGGMPDPEHLSFAGILASIERPLMTLRRPLIVAGHSFGAVWAAALVQRTGAHPDYVGYIALAAPLSAASYTFANSVFAAHIQKDRVLAGAMNDWSAKHTREALAQLYASYGALYFSAKNIARGSAMLKQDKFSLNSDLQILRVLTDHSMPVDFDRQLRAVALPKYVFAGAEDLLFPPAGLKRDAAGCNCGFRVIPQASHFVTFDNPEAVAGSIEQLFR